MSTTAPVHVEKKVVTGTLVTLLAGAAIAVLNGVNGSQTLSSLDVPAWAQGMLLTVIPAALQFLGSYVTKHSVRPDLDDSFDDGGADTVVTV